MTETLLNSPKKEGDRREIAASGLSLRLERVKFLTDQLMSALPPLAELEEARKELDDEITNELMQLALSMRLRKDIDRDALEAFKKRPFTFTPYVDDKGQRREDWYYLLMPRFVDMQIGWLEKQDLSYNHFVVNRYLDWLGELPGLIKKELGFKPPPQLEYRDGFITGEPSAIDNFARKNPNLLKVRRGNKLIVRPKRHFEVLAALVKEGVLPFNPQSVPQELLVNRKCDIEPRSYQREAWKVLLEWSHIGVFYPASVGKSYFGIWVLAQIKPPSLVVVPTVLLKETWEERILLHTDLKLGEEVEVLAYPTAIKRYSNQSKKQFNLKIYDECHHLGADELSRLVTIPSAVSLGLTATPMREDKREEFIYAFTGRPHGLSWDHFRKLNLIRNPVCHVDILKSVEAKVKYIGELAEGKKTLVFCDSIELGTIVSKRYDVPHVYGATKKDRLKTIQDAPLVVVSRVGDEGISLPEVEQIIEISWLGKSRRQELQRFTRLLHSQVGVGDLPAHTLPTDRQALQELRRLREPEYHILMTLDEYARDRKRLFSIMDKGFKVEIHRERVSERQFTRTQQERGRKVRITPHDAPSPSQSETQPIAPTAAPSGLPPGMQKLYLTLTEPQQRLISHLYLRDGEWHSTSKIYPFLNYTTYQGMINSTKLPELERRKIIERKTGYVRTNFRGLKE
jgi:DNA excision repair protein ERCC-3